ncbi:MAG TPA: phosphohistidine phosphatase SixA [Vicinamibacterales bacterium]|nr:phosphohistidine phosphatase SixA [Vicinamibacterales bacterium]
MEPCDLYIVRHAIAAERGEEWPDDTKRPLTDTGITRFKEAVAGLAWFDVEIDEIFTSPLVRAKQTAAILAHGLGNKTSVKTLEALAPGHSPRQVMSELSRAAKRHRIALVGHEPGLGELAAHVIASSRALPFKKGGICCIALQGLTSRRPGELVWFLPPKVLRRLAR